MRVVPLVAACAIVVAVVALYFYMRYRTWLVPQKCIPVFSHRGTEVALDAPPPKTIPVWMFWDRDPLPDVIQTFWNNWQHWCARGKYNFVPVLLTDTNVDQYVDTRAHPCLDQATTYGPALRSDFLRLELLSRYGGVWLDATIALTEPLDWIFGDDKRGHLYFQAVFNPRNMNMGCDVPVIETSFLYAPPNHPLVVEWLRRLKQLDNCEARTLTRMVHETPHQAFLTNTYHVVYHVMTQMLIDKPLSEYGSHHLYDALKFKSLNMLLQPARDLVSKHHSKVSYGRLLKLWSRERKEIEAALKNGDVRPGSFVHKFLIQPDS